MFSKISAFAAAAAISTTLMTTTAQADENLWDRIIDTERDSIGEIVSDSSIGAQFQGASTGSILGMSLFEDNDTYGLYQPLSQSITGTRSTGITVYGGERDGIALSRNVTDLQGGGVYSSFTYGIGVESHEGKTGATAFIGLNMQF